MPSKPNDTSATPEEHFRALLNSCLHERHTEHKVNFVNLRRTSVVCKDQTRNTPSQCLEPTDIWLEKYKPGKLRRKRVDVYAGMAGFSQR